MNPYERMTARLAGDPVDRPPNHDIFMTFAARCIGRPLRDYYVDHRALVEANMYVIENFDVDIVQAISDPYRETADFGAEVELPDDDMPMSMIPLIQEPEDIKNWSNPALTPVSG